MKAYLTSLFVVIPFVGCGLVMPMLLASKRPNFIILYADDLGWPGTSVLMDTRVPDSKSDYYQTPNLERLAANGMTFSNGYAGSPVCSASRASLQVGMSTAAHGLTALTGWKGLTRHEHSIKGCRNKTDDIRPYVTLPEQLKQIDNRYATAHFGKWHLMAGGPEANGFDHSDGNTGNRQGDVGGDDPKLTFGISRQGIRFMKDSAKSNRPFFLQLSYYAVHLEMMALKATMRKYEAIAGGKKHGNPLYAAMTEDLDTGIGMVLEAVRELGIEYETYVVFTSDNGPYVNVDQRRIKGEIGSSLPLRHGKFWVYEGGIRVPMIISGPGIKRGQRSNATVTQYDLYPTFCDLAGGNWPEAIEGGSLKPIWTERKAPRVKRPYDFLIWHYPHFNRQASPHTALISGDHKLIRFWEDDAVFLYDLQNDPTESRNLVDSRAKLTQTLLGKMDAYLAEKEALIPQSIKKR